MSLRVQGLCKTFTDRLTLKKKQVLFDVSFVVPQGSITGFLGSNGSGKTTTMKSILSLIRYEKGSVEFFEGQYKQPKNWIGYLPERPYFYEYLTGLEFLVFYGELCTNISKKDLKDVAMALLNKVGLDRAHDKLLRNFSKGMLQRIGLAQAIIHQPKFLILDEPMSGLDPDGRWQVTELIKEIAQGGATIFFSSHLLLDVERLCDRLVIINQGKIIFEGQQSEFLKSNHVGYEVIYQATPSTSPSVHVCENIKNVHQFLLELQKLNHLLIEVRQPRLNLEQAFNAIKNKHNEALNENN